ncbi:MAG TPA: hypothetical protein VK364_13800, partial [Hymenobacter sp.]|nr:hypothetical protein [Hymenobacter sp.]
RRRDARAAAVLEPLNAWRRHIGLAPVTPALARRGFEGDSLIHLSSRESDDARRYGPYLGMKHLRYAGEARRVLWEVDVWFLCSAGCKTPDQRVRRLERVYTADSRPTWSFNLLGGGTRSLTRAEADSVLTYWKAQGTRDSLAALRH